MYHDTPEIITGDMPTPVKYSNSQIITAYKQIEKAAEQRLMELLPEDFKEEFEAIYSPDPEIARLVKAADKLSALIKCTEELNMGNQEFAAAYDSVLAAVKALHCPEADVFLAEFMPGFSLTLDEQNNRSEGKT